MVFAKKRQKGLLTGRFLGNKGRVEGWIVEIGLYGSKMAG